MASSASAATDFLANGGEMGDRIRAFDWKNSSLGPITSWSASLKTAVAIALQSPIPIVMFWGTDGVMIYNDAYSVFAGQRHPFLLGSKVLEGWPEVADFNRNVMKTVLKRGKTLSYKDQQLKLYRNNVAEDVWMDLNYSPVMDERGKPEGVWAIVVENTKRVLAERKQKIAEDALQAEKRRLTSLFMHAPAAIAVMSGPDLVYELANVPYRQLIGEDRPVIGRPLMEVLPDLQPYLQKIIKGVAFEGKRYVASESPVVLDWDRTGKPYTKYLNFTYEPVFDEQKKPDGFIAFAYDVTEQITIRRRVEESESRLRFMSETMPQKVFTALPDGTVDYFNPEWNEFTGLTVAQIRTVGWQQLVHPDDAKQNIRAWKHALKTGEPLQVEHRFRRHDGEYHWHLTRARAMRDDQGAIVRWFGTSTDIQEIRTTTARKNELETVAETLRHQQEELVALNEAKDEFISVASHQLRTPATAVKQYLGMVLEGYAGDTPPPQRSLLDRAWESNERQISIINDLLKVAQIDAGKVYLQRCSVDVVKLTSNVLEEQSGKFKERSQEIVFTYTHKVLLAHIDAQRIHMVLENIIDNASKYTEPGKRMYVRLSKRRGHVMVAVRDEGVGIDTADIDKLFRKFTRLDNPLSVIVGGNGLGLYWAKKIIDLHEGSIAVTSKIHEGTTFTISLPA